MKKNSKEEVREIPKKNYYIVIIVSILVIILTLYIRSFYLTYQSNKTNESIFYDKSINQINADDLDFAIAETNEAILYISYTGSKEIKTMEKKLFKEIEKKNLNDKVLYWDISNLMKKNKYLEVLKNKFSNVAVDINKAPLLIYLKDGEALEVVDSEEKLIDLNDLNDLLIKYGIE